MCSGGLLHLAEAQGWEQPAPVRMHQPATHRITCSRPPRRHSVSLCCLVTVAYFEICVYQVLRPAEHWARTWRVVCGNGLEHVVTVCTHCHWNAWAIMRVAVISVWSGASGEICSTGPGCKLRASMVVTNSRRCLLYTSPSPRDRTRSRMPSSA